MPVAFFADGPIYYHHQDWLGTERMRTTDNGTVEGSYPSLPFGDGYSASGTDDDAYHFAGLDQDSSTNEHATFREYSNLAGRWLSPDPYIGSYDLFNPQSTNRYAYAFNNPLTYVDPLGLDALNLGLSEFAWAFGNVYWGSDFGDGTGGGGSAYEQIGDGAPGGGGGGGSASYGPPTLAPNNPTPCTNGVGTGGVGVGAGYNADLGVGAAGVSSTGGVGGGLFHNSGGGASGGLFGSGGAASYFNSHIAGAPPQTSSSFVLGAYAGAGANFFFTNAGGAQQLGGPFTTVSINVGVGVANLGVQLSFGGGIFQLGVTPPFASVGIGAAGSVIRTNTITTHAGCH